MKISEYTVIKIPRFEDENILLHKGILEKGYTGAFQLYYDDDDQWKPVMVHTTDTKKIYKRNSVFVFYKNQIPNVDLVIDQITKNTIKETGEVIKDE